MDRNELNAIFPIGEKGKVEWFTGNANYIEMVDADSVYTTAIGKVYFEPGARSNWHTHPNRLSELQKEKSSYIKTKNFSQRYRRANIMY